MNVQQAVELATAKLSQTSDSANLDARIIVCHVCNTKQTTLIAHPELELNYEQNNLFKTCLERRIQGEPLAYIAGSKEFWSLDFIVNEHVLIPRPETELIVELALNSIADIKKPKVLDLGAGCGAIAIAIAKEQPDSKLVATEIDALALEVAKKNAEKHKLKIEFIQSDWFANIANNKFDLIVSNPPYINEDDPHLDKYVYQYEPRKALISKQNGLEALTIIIAQAKSFLTQPGTLIVEHGFQQAESVGKLFRENKYNNIQCHKDISGHLRCTSGCR